MPAADPLPTDIVTGDVEIRHVRTHDEFVACVALQHETWGAAFREVVPAAILKVTQRIGGVTAGAFAADGTLLGFVFGVTGVEHGALVHWSDMLAVSARAQNHGLGRRLKEFQREALRAFGVTRMYWTYDPLVARNAHFNLNSLRAQVTEYVPDMYGSDTGSAMHSGLGTDRLIVVWPIVPALRGTAEAVPLEPDWGSALMLNAGMVEDGDADLAARAALPAAVRIEIPGDIFQVQATSPARAIRWRATTRDAFQWALGSGYSVVRFEQDARAQRGCYLLARLPSSATFTTQ